MSYPWKIHSHAELPRCQHTGVNVDSSRQEVHSFGKTTDVSELASELEDKLPEDQHLSDHQSPETRPPDSRPTDGLASDGGFLA